MNVKVRLSVGCAKIHIFLKARKEEAKKSPPLFVNRELIAKSKQMIA